VLNVVRAPAGEEHHSGAPHQQAPCHCATEARRVPALCLHPRVRGGGRRLVFGAGRKAGILPPEAGAPPRVDFVGFGLVLGMDGKRIRTRDEGAVRAQLSADARLQYVPCMWMCHARQGALRCTAHKQCGALVMTAGGGRCAFMSSPCAWLVNLLAGWSSLLSWAWAAARGYFGVR